MFDDYMVVIGMVKQLDDCKWMLQVLETFLSYHFTTTETILVQVYKNTQQLDTHKKKGGGTTPFPEMLGLI